MRQGVFSNGTSHLSADKVLGAVCGIGPTIFEIEGRKLLEDEPDSATFDYAMINYPIFFANTIAHYIFIQRLGGQGAQRVSHPGRRPPQERIPRRGYSQRCN